MYSKSIKNYKGWPIYVNIIYDQYQLTNSVCGTV